MKRTMGWSQPKPGSAHVLLVEDNMEAQVVIVATLRHSGYAVRSADTIAAAVDSAAAEKPDVVLLDCRLPDGDGLELVRRWRDDARMRDVPVIVLTAFYARQDMEAALLAGVDAFLVKPCSGAVLSMQIEKVLSGQRPSRTMRRNP
jgi:DNA-binding response OmpR family regulator